MDGNKDEAQKCLRIGQEVLEKGDRTRALKFFIKARRLDPSLPIEDLISKISEESTNSSGIDPAASTKSSRDEVFKQNTNSSARARVSADSSSPSSKAYSEKQMSVVRQIKKEKDYYKILGLEKGCSVEDVRKAYRKLSLKVHPDKNQAPGSEEAFKLVSKAFQCLSNEESRKHYDLVGSEEVVYNRPRRASPGFNGFYDGAEIDPEEIFRNFFFGGVPMATTTFGGFRFGNGMGPNMRTGETQRSPNSNFRALIQILPILLVILLNFLPSLEPIYALNRSYPYEHQFATERGVAYFVRTSKFEQEYPSRSLERVALEKRVEKEYFTILSQNCRVELQRRQWGLTQNTPHCDMLKQYRVEA